MKVAFEKYYFDFYKIELDDRLTFFFIKFLE